MADDDDEDEDRDEDDEDGEDGEGGPPKKGGKGKLIIIGAVVFLLVGGGVGAYFAGLLDSVLGVEAEEEVEDVTVEGQVFYKLETITLNLKVEGRKAKFLAIGLTLVLLNEADIPKVELMLPRISNYVLGYLRERKPEELLGSANFYRIREDLLVRVQVAVSPVKVTNVLFNSVVVQ